MHQELTGDTGQVAEARARSRTGKLSDLRVGGELKSVEVLIIISLPLAS